VVLDVRLERPVVDGSEFLVAFVGSVVGLGWFTTILLAGWEESGRDWRGPVFVTAFHAALLALVFASA
jgi:hypothetical protein